MNLSRGMKTVVSRAELRRRLSGNVSLARMFSRAPSSQSVQWLRPRRSRRGRCRRRVEREAAHALQAGFSSMRKRPACRPRGEDPTRRRLGWIDGQPAREVRRRGEFASPRSGRVRSIDDPHAIVAPRLASSGLSATPADRARSVSPPSLIATFPIADPANARQLITPAARCGGSLADGERAACGSGGISPVNSPAWSQRTPLRSVRPRLRAQTASRPLLRSSMLSTRRMRGDSSSSDPVVAVIGDAFDLDVRRRL